MVSFQNRLRTARSSALSILLCIMLVLFAFIFDSLAVSPKWIGVGENQSDQYGSSVCSADVNGDGYDDVIVGAPGFSENTGRVYVYLGSPSGLVETPAITLTGETPDMFGVKVSSAWDVNGDGYDDVIVGFGNNYPYGKVKIYYGSHSGLIDTFSITLIGGTEGDLFGRSFSSTGDVNGDGYDDVIVGAPGTNVTYGGFYIYLGSPSGLSATASITVTSQIISDGFGQSVSSAGDVNGDGFGDMVVGAGGPNSASKVYIYLGSPLGLTPTPSSILTGHGCASACSADMNGDGFDDVVIGAPGGSDGRVYIYLGSSSGLTTDSIMLMGDSSYYEYGSSVSCADVNGDGLGDVIVGAPDHYTGVDYGKVYVYLSPLSLLRTGPSLTLIGDAGSDHYGSSVCSADVNGDGFSDIVVGDDAYGNYTGRASVYQTVPSPWRPEYLPLVSGTVWQFLVDGQHEVTREVFGKKTNVNGISTSVVKYIDENIKEYYTADSNGVLLHRQYQPNVYVQGVGWVNIDVTFDPPINFSGTVVGGTFRSQGAARTKVSSRGTYDFGYTADTTIEATENISVPAGNFDTIRVRGSITLLSPYGSYTTSSTRYLAAGIGIVKNVSTDTQGTTSTAELVYTNAGIYDLAITGITPPKKVTLSSSIPSKTSTLKLKIQNKGPFEETIEDASMLTNLITVTAESLGTCPAPSPILHAGKPQKPFPIILKPGKTLTVYYDVNFDCANDAAQGTPDYRFSAVVNRATLGGKADSNPANDVCPRDSISTDKGCGTKKPDGTLGGDILTDVIVK